jgi:predicted O-linked N-acetylglucosamine transferase (SPINDLY family)
VFCCFNNTFKLTPAYFAIWARLLAAVPDSVLWLLGANELVEGNLRHHAATLGLDPARLVFAPRLALAEHLARYRVADLFLDTGPYNAHTTASDALWAGLPVLTVKGDTFAGRVAASLLSAIGLPELITTSAAEYEALALALAGDALRRAALRRRLGDLRATQPLFDSRRFTAAIEDAFLRLWESGP